MRFAQNTPVLATLPKPNESAFSEVERVPARRQNLQGRDGHMTLTYDLKFLTFFIKDN